MNSDLITCAISGLPYPHQQAIPLSKLDATLQTFLRQHYSGLTDDSFIGIDQLPGLQRQQVSQLLADEAGEVSNLEQEVIDSVRNNLVLSSDVEEDIEQQRTFGERIADAVAAFGGSWTFIICFFTFFTVWMIINAIMLHEKGFDPYPFILLNLILSCLAAIQAPIIMMSQNRREDKDRQRSEHDYQINLKAELEIKLLHKKIDHILDHQNRRLLDIQQVQTEMLGQLAAQFERPAATTKSK